MALRRLYLDSNVFISFVKQEIGKHFRLLGSEAQSFFSKCSGKYTLVLSDYFFKEVKKVAYYEREAVCEVFSGLKIELEFVNTTRAELEAELDFKLGGMHFPDSLHAALAWSFNCDAIVTFNKKDFEGFLKEIEVLEPLDLSN